jgi:hypothetical protein
MIACLGNRLRPARRAGPTTDTRRQTHSGVGGGGRRYLPGEQRAHMRQPPCGGPAGSRASTRRDLGHAFEADGAPREAGGG